MWKWFYILFIVSLYPLYHPPETDWVNLRWMGGPCCLFSSNSHKRVRRINYVTSSWLWSQYHTLLWAKRILWHLQGFKYGFRNIFSDLREAQLSRKAFYCIQSKIQVPEPSRLLLTPKLLQSSTLSHALVMGLLQLLEHFIRLPTWEPLHILDPLPKMPLSSFFAWPTPPQASEISSQVVFSHPIN